jgi:hypothetical protein
VALAPVGGGDAADHPYRLIGTQRTQRVNNDGTLTPIVNITAQSVLYGVQFTFTILASTFDTDGGPPLTAERTNWVDEICGHAHVQGFWSEQDQGPDQILYNYGVITVGTDDGAITDQVRVRMDHLNDSATFGAIDASWKRLQALGAS